MLPRYAAACNQMSAAALHHLLAAFGLSQEPKGSAFEHLRPISHAAATLTLLRAGYRADAELLLGRPITHLAPQPAAPLLVCGTAALLNRLAAALPAESGPTSARNTRLPPAARLAWVGPQAKRVGARRGLAAALRPGATVGTLLRRGVPRRRLSEAVRRGWVTLAPPQPMA